MNTEGENNYYDVMTSDRINIITKETKQIEYDFQVTAKIMEEFNEWKLEILQNTDIPPSDIEILNYFKKIRTNSCSGTKFHTNEVKSICYIDKDTQELEWVNNYLSEQIARDLKEQEELEANIQSSYINPIEILKNNK
jgi:hypothetical protein